MFIIGNIENEEFKSSIADRSDPGINNNCQPMEGILVHDSMFKMACGFLNDNIANIYEYRGIDEYCNHLIVDHDGVVRKTWMVRNMLFVFKAPDHVDRDDVADWFNGMVQLGRYDGTE